MKRAIVIAAMLFASIAAADDEAASLRDGHVEITSLDVKGSSIPITTVRAIVAQPPAKVWAVLSDCAHYKERMPRIAKSTLLEHKDNTFVCEVTLETPFPMPNLTAVTEATHDVTDARMTRTWKLLRGDYEYNEGMWEVRAIDEGKGSLVTYRVHAKPKANVPGFLREMAEKKALPELIERVRAEAAKMK